MGNERDLIKELINEIVHDFGDEYWWSWYQWLSIERIESDIRDELYDRLKEYDISFDSEVVNKCIKSFIKKYL